MSDKLRGIWSCKIGEVEHAALPYGADFPMRRAVENAYHELTGQWPVFIFSGWNTDLTPTEEEIATADKARKEATP